MKRIILLASLLVLAALFTGCRCSHEWTDATCNEAKRCRLCGEHQGNALGHSWKEASCEEKKTCITCGKTEGEALGHSWKAATCARGEFCPQCGQTRGEPLEHTWVEASCAKPKHCTGCGATEGTAIGHSWMDATCTTAKTCNICAITEGEPLGHSWTKATCTKPQSCLLCGLWTTPALGHSWLEATCTEPVRCEFCDVTQGEPLGHDWQEATFETPKTCRVCGLEEGLPIERDDRFIPEDCQILFGQWQYILVTTAEELNVPGFDRDLEERITYTFGLYGTLEILTEVVDPDCYRDYLVALAVDRTYVSLEGLGMDKEAADAYWLEEYGKTILEHQQEVVDTDIRENGMNYTESYVYYVAEDAICISMHWEDYFDGWTFTVDADVLTMTNELTGQVLEMTRVIEDASNPEEEEIV